MVITVARCCCHLVASDWGHRMSSTEWTSLASRLILIRRPVASSGDHGLQEQLPVLPYLLRTTTLRQLLPLTVQGSARTSPPRESLLDLPTLGEGTQPAVAEISYGLSPLPLSQRLTPCLVLIPQFLVYHRCSVSVCQRDG